MFPRVRHDTGVQVATDKPQHPLVADALRQPAHEHVVIDPVEKFFEVDVYHHSLPRLDIPLRLTHRLMCAAPRSEAIAVLREGWVKHRLKHLQNGLLDEPIEHAGNPELPDSPTALRNFLPPHWLRLVRAIEQLRPYGLPVVHQIRRQLIHGHPVSTGAALVLPHPLQRGLGVAALDYLLHEAVVS